MVNVNTVFGQQQKYGITLFYVKAYRHQNHEQLYTGRDGRADNAQALKACDPPGRVGSNPTPDAKNKFQEF